MSDDTAAKEVTTSEDSKNTTSESKQDKHIPYDRFKSVIDEKNQIAKQLEELNKKIEQDQKKQLEEQEKYKELYDKTSQELETFRAQVEQNNKKMEAIKKASELGFQNPEHAYNLVAGSEDMSEALQNLASENDYLLKKPDQATTSELGAKVQKADSKSVWKWSELKQLASNASWYKENQEEYKNAVSEGRIDYSK